MAGMKFIFLTVIVVYSYSIVYAYYIVQYSRLPIYKSLGKLPKN